MHPTHLRRPPPRRAARPVTRCMVRPAAALAAAWLLAGPALPLAAQSRTPFPTERVNFTNPQDGMRLNGELAIPNGPGPHPGVVLLSVAGTNPIVERLVADGFAVLAPELRGFARVEPLLQASFLDLAGDVAAAATYLGGRPEVDGEALGVIAQGDNAPQAIVFAAERGASVWLVLLAPPGFTGPELFRLEQRGVAQNQGWGPSELDALDIYVREISDIVLSSNTARDRAFRLEAARARTRVDLPRNAAFPTDGQQTHFFSSPLWYDRLAFDPEAALSGIQGPVLVLIGADDPNTPMDAYLSAMRRGLAASRTRDGAVCRIPGRTRHTFSQHGVAAIAEWVGVRTGSGGDGMSPSGCLADDEHP